MKRFLFTLCAVALTLTVEASPPGERLQTFDPVEITDFSVSAFDAAFILTDFSVNSEPFSFVAIKEAFSPTFGSFRAFPPDKLLAGSINRPYEDNLKDLSGQSKNNRSPRDSLRYGYKAI